MIIDSIEPYVLPQSTITNKICSNKTMSKIKEETVTSATACSPVKLVNLPKAAQNRVIQVQWSHKESVDDEPTLRIKSLKVRFNGKEDYTVQQVIQKFKENIVRSTSYTLEDFHNCLEDLALPNEVESEPAQIIYDFKDGDDRPCTIWNYIKLHKISQKYRYFMLHLITEQMDLKEDPVKDNQLDSK